MTVQKDKEGETTRFNWLPLLCVATIFITGIAYGSFVGWDTVINLITTSPEDAGTGPYLLRAGLHACFMVTVVVCMLPVPPVMIMFVNGYVFGFLPGFALNYVSGICGLLATCVLVRAGLVQHFLDAVPQISKIVRVLEAQDWKFLLLFRFVHQLPTPVRNYTAALLDLPLWRKALFSTPGMLVKDGFAAYCGSKSHTMQKASHEGIMSMIHSSFGSGELVFLSMSVVASMILATCAYREFQKHMTLAEEDSKNANSVVDERAPLVHGGERAV